jgi:hypothetical protein
MNPVSYLVGHIERGIIPPQGHYLSRELQHRKNGHTSISQAGNLITSHLNYGNNLAEIILSSS